MQEVIKKFKFKAKGAVINAPVDLKEAFIQLGFQPAFADNSRSQNTLVFIQDNKELLHFLTNELKNIEPDSVLWLAYPKGTSKIATDIHRDTIRKTIETFSITTVAAVSINDTWSALRLRPINKVGQ